MELRPAFTTEIYTIFQDLHIAVKGYAITIKRSKKSKKGELQKV